MSRLIAKLRSRLSRLTVQHNDLKQNFSETTKQLESQIAIEKKKRI